MFDSCRSRISILGSTPINPGKNLIVKRLDQAIKRFAPMYPQPESCCSATGDLVDRWRVRKRLTAPAEMRSVVPSVHCGMGQSAICGPVSATIS